MASFWTCDQCKEVFELSKLLERHVLQSSHKAYQCSHAGCMKTFSARPSWLRHEKNHTGVKQHSCTICWKTFQRKDNCEEHEYRCRLRSREDLVTASNGPDLTRQEVRSYALPTSDTSMAAQIMLSLQTENHSASAPSSIMPGPQPTPNARSFSCPVNGCGKAYRTSNDLRDLREHGHAKQQLQDNGDGTLSVPDPVTLLPYPTSAVTALEEASKLCSCLHCGKGYKNANRIKYHLRRDPNCSELAASIEVKESAHAPTSPRSKEPQELRLSTEVDVPLTIPMVNTAVLWLEYQNAKDERLS